MAKIERHGDKGKDRCQCNRPEDKDRPPVVMAYDPEIAHFGHRLRLVELSIPSAHMATGIARAPLGAKAQLISTTDTSVPLRTITDRLGEVIGTGDLSFNRSLRLV